MGGIFQKLVYMQMVQPPSAGIQLPAPTILVSDITSKSAKISIAFGGTQNGVGFELSINGGSAIAVTNPYVMSGLTAGTTYSLRSRAVGEGYISSEYATEQFTTVVIPQEPTVINVSPADAFYNSKIAGQQPINPQPATNALSTWKFNIEGVDEITLGLLTNNRDDNYKTGNFAVYIGNELIDTLQPTQNGVSQDFTVNTAGKDGVLRIKSGSTQRSYEQGNMFSSAVTKVAASNGLLQKIAPVADGIVAFFRTDSIGVMVGADNPPVTGYAALLSEEMPDVSFFMGGYGSGQAYALFNSTIAMDAFIAEMKRAFATATKKLILLHLGINDAIAPTVAPSVLLPLFQAGVNRIKSEIPDAVITVLTPFNTAGDTNNNSLGFSPNDYKTSIGQITDVAVKTDTNVIPNDGFADGVHPNKKGHRAAADYLKPIIQSLIQ